MARERYEAIPIPPIESWFIARHLPDGEAPVSIRQQWIDVPLPVRYERPIEAPDPKSGGQIFSRKIVVLEDAVVINVDDAIKALELFGKAEAAVWWGELPRRGLSNLVFDLQWGDWISNEFACRKFPQIKDFDAYRPRS